MQIHEQKHGAVTVLIPEGPLIQEDAEAFRLRAMTLYAKSLGRIVVDGSKMPFVDSKGLETLLDLSDHIGQSGNALKLASINKTIREVLTLTELDHVFEQFEDVNTAVRSFL